MTDVTHHTPPVPFPTRAPDVPQSLPRRAWRAAHRAYREARGREPGTAHGPEHEAGIAAWMAVGACPEAKWAAQSLGVFTAVCRPYRAKATIGRVLIQAVRDCHGRAKARWIVSTLARGNVRGPERLPGAHDPWRAYASRVAVRKAA